MSIVNAQTASSEIVLSERVVTTDYRIVQINESIINRFVQVEVELGPFTEEVGPGQTTILRGTSRRGITVWQNEDYDAIRDTWTNTDLINAVAEKV